MPNRMNRYKLQEIGLLRRIQVLKPRTVRVQMMTLHCEFQTPECDDEYHLDPLIISARVQRVQGGATLLVKELPVLLEGTMGFY